MEDVYLEGWELLKVGPSAIYRPTSLDNVGIGFALSRKVAELSEECNLPKSAFRAWLLMLEPNVSAIFLHGPEILSDDHNPLSALLVVEGLQRPDAWNAGLPFIQAGATSWKRLFTDLAQPEAKILRSFLSSELCVILRKEQEREKAVVSNEVASGILEANPILDLAEMIVFDVLNKIKTTNYVADEVCFEGKDVRAIKKIHEQEFSRIAINAMEKRRIIKPVQKRLVPEVKKAFVK